MKIKEITDEIEKLAPLSLQEDYDNCGFQVGNPDDEATSALICFDVTPEVVHEAIKKNCNLIISHHPLIFRGLKKIIPQSDIQKTIILALQNGITIYSAHTNIDNAVGGMNAKIAEKIGLVDCGVLSPMAETDFEQAGAGMIGNLKKPMTETDFLIHIKSTFNIPVIRHTQFLNKKVSRVAFVGGAGASFLSDAISKKADVFLTSDIKYHDFFLAENKILFADFGHFESEQYIKETFFDIIRKKIPNFVIQISETITNPINYL